MNVIKKLASKLDSKLKSMSKSKKTQLAAAVFVTLTVIVTAVVYAWFSFGRGIAFTTKINAPTAIQITAGNKEAVTNLDLSGIDVTDGTSKNYVFGVAGESVNNYKIQLAHTTNIPFTYTLYRATSNDAGDTTADVVYTSTSGSSYYYKKGSTINGNYLNKDESTSIAKESGAYHNETYDTYTRVQKNAEPLYWQSESLNVENKNNDGSFVDYFIIDVSWTEGLTNDKETDMIYITVMKES